MNKDSIIKLIEIFQRIDVLDDRLNDVLGSDSTEFGEINSDFANLIMDFIGIPQDGSFLFPTDKQDFARDWGYDLMWNLDDVSEPKSAEQLYDALLKWREELFQH